MDKSYETPLCQKAKAQVQVVRSDKELEVSYMTIAQKMRDERRMGFKEGRAEGHAEGINEAIAVLKGSLEPAIIAEKFKTPLEQVLIILEQA